MSANRTSVDAIDELALDCSKNFGYNTDQSILTGETGLQRHIANYRNSPKIIGKTGTPMM